MDKKDIAMQRGLVSIIVPIYNIEQYLERCIDSIINQTYHNIEIILMDDGSTDGSGNICDQYKRIDPRISVFHERHAGTSRARNVGLSHAKGEFIGFVDSDDYLAPDMYETLLCNMNDEIDITCCGRRCVVPGKKSYNAYCPGAARKFSVQEAFEELLLLRHISFSVCTKLFRRELFCDIRFPVGNTCEDIPVTYHLIKKSRGILHIGTPKYYNFYRENSRSSHLTDARWMDYTIAARDILLDIKRTYPQLERQAEARYLLSAMITLKGIQESKNNFTEEKDRLKRMLRAMFLRGILNPYIQKLYKKALIKCMILRSVDWTKI